MELIITNRKKQKFVVLYDDCDHELISKYTWHIESVKIPYVRATVRLDNGKFISIRMHRLILDIVGTEYFGDHINHNILDNRRCNIRKCTLSQNNMNRKPCGESKYLGVCRSTGRNKWQATIKIIDKYKNLGRYDNEIDAAKAYDAKAREIHGEFANLNFPERKII